MSSCLYFSRVRQMKLNLSSVITLLVEVGDTAKTWGSGMQICTPLVGIPLWDICFRNPDASMIRGTKLLCGSPTSSCTVPAPPCTFPAQWDQLPGCLSSLTHTSSTTLDSHASIARHPMLCRQTPHHSPWVPSLNHSTPRGKPIRFCDKVSKERSGR